MIPQEHADRGWFIIVSGAVVHSAERVPYIYRGWSGPNTAGNHSHHFVVQLSGTRHLFWEEYRAVKLDTLRRKFPAIDRHVLTLLEGHPE